MIWGVNFGQANITNAVLEAQAMLKAFSSPAVKGAGITLELIEIGNEADLYGDRQQPWDVSVYVQQCVMVSYSLAHSHAFLFHQGGPSSQRKWHLLVASLLGQEPNSMEEPLPIRDSRPPRSLLKAYSPTASSIRLKGN